MDAHGQLAQAVIFLVATVVAVPLFKRLGLGTVLGYLAAGVVIGPSALGLVTDVEAIMHVSELGVVMLLFIIGLELKPSTLWQMRRSILGTGGAQVVLTTLALFGIAKASGLSTGAALVIGMALSLSSTAIALQILGERNLMPTPAGVQAFSTLLFQDMAVIPMLAVVPLLAVAAPGTAESAAPGWLGALKIVGVVVGLIAGGRLLTRPLFRFVAGTRVREAFTAFALLIVLGIALLMQAVGLSMALGTFLAGVILAESEYRHELEVDIEPFKGLLLGLFFISVGMGIDFGIFLKEPLKIFLLVLGLVAVKGGVAMAIAKVARLPLSQAALFAIVLSQVGEFAFVLFNMAGGLGVMTRGELDLAGAAVALSMVTTPLLMIVNDRVIQPRFATKDARPEDTVVPVDGGVIIAGFGRFGQIIGRLLHAQGIPTTVLDHDPSQIDLVRRFGYKVFYGDATRLELLEAAGAAKARLFVVAVDDVATSMAIVKLVQEHFPRLPIYARARNRNHAQDLIEVGVAFQIRESFESAVSMAESALAQLGFHPFRARTVGMRFRKHDNETMAEMLKLRGDQKALVSFNAQSRAMLEQLMKADAEDCDELRDASWG